MRGPRERAGPVVIVALLLPGLLGAADGGAGALFAGRLTADDAAARRVGGPDAIAGVGDWALGNGVICAAISDPSHESTLSDRGGVLVDLGHCGRGDDQWGALQPLVNLSRRQTVPVEGITAEVTADAARLVTTGQLSGLRFRTVFEAGLAQPRRLRITTEIERASEGDALFLFGEVSLHGHRQLTPFTIADGRPELGVGFIHPAIDVDSALSMVAAMLRADVQVLIGGSRLEPQIAYGWRITEAFVERRDGEREPLAHLALNGEHFSILGVYADTLLLGGRGKPGLLELAQTLWMDLESGERLVVVREILLGRRADAASVTDQLWPTGARIVGRVNDPSVRLHVNDARGRPITFVRPEPDGRFAFRLPPGPAADYTVSVSARGRRLDAMPIPTESTGSVIDLGTLGTGEAAEVVLPTGEPMRLVFLGVAPTPDPIFAADGLAFFVGEDRVRATNESNDISLAGGPGAPVVARLAPGTYRVLASRGPEWSVTERTLALSAGQRSALAIAPPVRLVERSGALAADLHVHAAPSDDSALPLAMRIAAFAAQDADVIVSTEHDNVFDYAPTIRAMGLADRIASLAGVEITSTVVGDVTPHTNGHANAFPLDPRPLAYRGGAPRGENRRLRDVVADLRARPERPLLQLNHPREGGFDSGLGAFFEHLAVAGEPLDPARALDAAPNAPLGERDPSTGLRDVDFDAIELLNGPSMRRYRKTRADWFSLLLQGEVRTATANSDSHAAYTVVGMPRSYVAYAGPRGQALDVDGFLAAVRAGRLHGSTGPVLDVRLGDGGPGEIVRTREATLVVQVSRADWVPADTVRVFVDGVLRERRALPADGRIALPLAFAADAFVTVEVEGAAAPGSLYALLAPGFTPFAFTNPIFVDADDRAGWTAPGLPEPAPLCVRAPLACED